MSQIDWKKVEARVKYFRLPLYALYIYIFFLNIYIFTYIFIHYTYISMPSPFYIDGKTLISNGQCLICLEDTF